MFENLYNEACVDAIRMLVTICMILLWIMVGDIVWHLLKH